MTTSPHDADAPGHEGAVAHHALDDHGEDHGHDDHAHAEDALGPVDRAAWSAGILGVAIGIVIAFCFVLATSAPA
jgi:hypothetical protein